MSIDFEEVIASRTFEFLLGTEKKSFTMHESLVAYYSQTLKAMMMGSMAEAKDGCAILLNVEPSTFVRFAQYVYTGDYTVPAPSISIDPSEQEVEDKTSKEIETDVEQPVALDSFTQREIARVPEPLDKWMLHDRSATQTDDWGFGSVTKKAHKKNTRPTIDFGDSSDHPKASSLVRLEFGKRFADACNESEYRVQQRLRTPPIHRNEDPREEMIEVLLAHARVYVFGDTYAVRELALLSVHKLRQSLSALRLFPQRIADLVALISYSYANTLEDDALRQLVVDYSACMVEHLMEHQDFRALTKEDGSFSTDLLNKIMPRLG